MTGQEPTNKNRDITEKSGLKDLLLDAQKRYENWCLENNEKPHQSVVHSYSDVLQQAAVLALPAKTPENSKRIAQLTLYSHLLDDKIDPIENLGDKYQSWGGLGDFLKKSSSEIQAIAKKMISLGTNDKEKEAISSIIYNIFKGGQVQQSKTEGEQRAYVKNFKREAIKSIKNLGLKRSIKKLHPMLFYLTTHGDVGAFFDNEGFGQNKDLGLIYGAFYSPMLYIHNAKEESLTGEKFRVLFGKEMSEKGVIKEEYLFRLIDIFDKNISKIPDKNLKGHLKQMKVVYHSFEPVLSSSLRQRYQKSLSKFEKYVTEKEGDLDKKQFLSKGLENKLTAIIIALFSMVFLTNFTITGDVISENYNVKSLITFLAFVSGLFFLGLLIQIKLKARRFRNSFFR